MTDSSRVTKDIVALVERFSELDEITIGLLRYGAHIPHIYHNAVSKPRTFRLLLSHMIGFMPLEYFVGKRFRILDDTVYRGVQMQRVRRQLIEDCGVPEECISTAALVVHEESEYEPDLYQAKLQNVDYIVWKERLAAIVRNDIRPTERDHPLYYFQASNLTIGLLLDVLRNFGEVHPVGGVRSAVRVFRVALTMSTAMLDDLRGVTGVDFGEICKVRFYCYSEGDSFSLVATPLVLPTVELDRAVAELRVPISDALGFDNDFFDRVRASSAPNAQRAMMYYFLSRSLGAIVLVRLLSEMRDALAVHDIYLQSRPPRDVDGCVEYEFPEEYVDFHSAVMRRIAEALSAPISMNSMAELFPARNWRPVPGTPQATEPDAILPNEYYLAALVADAVDPALWDGRRWSPNYAIPGGITVAELAHRHGDALFVSRALDELLDSGLLRASDCVLREEGLLYGRCVFPGGEFKATEVARIASAFRRTKKQQQATAAAAEELCDLWGP